MKVKYKSVYFLKKNSAKLYALKSILKMFTCKNQV